MAGSDKKDSIWLYNPNFPLAIVFAILYSFPMVIQFVQTILRYKSYYFSVVFVGAAFEVAGYIVRAVSIKQPAQVSPYAVSSSFIIIAPLFVGAGNYLLISRLALRVLPTSIKRIYRIPVGKLTRIFVVCDVVTLLIQASGSGIASSGNWKGKMADVGNNVLIVGLAIQLATFTFFVVIVSKFHFLTRKEGNVSDEAGHAWKKVLFAVYISSTLIIIRCIYRLVEFALGIWGYPFTHEWMFYVFEALPMLPAIAIFCLWHPAHYFASDRLDRKSRSTSDVELQ
ncbi:RTA1 like protein-domain-containing protein [Halenospora varia]|nr:RTA1 like protein-domain-containing protein [Halenospora varia]